MLVFLRSRQLLYGAVLISTISFLITGCHPYKHTAISPGKAVTQVRYYIADEQFPEEFAWRIDASAVDQTGITGTLLPLSKKDAKKIAKGHPQDIGDTRILQTVVFFVKNEYAQTFFDSVRITLPFSKVTRCMVYEYNVKQSKTTKTIVIVGVSAVALTVLAVVCSCPYVYAETPDGVEFEGDIFTGATHPQLERHDWLPLSHLKPDNSIYRLQITNEDAEIQHINLLELIVVDHPAGVMALYDKYGRLQTLAHPESPVIATDLEGQDRKSAILKEDNDSFRGNPNTTNPRAEDGLLLSFRRPAGAQKAKLVIRANTSLWMAYSHELLQNDLGKYGPKVRQKFLEKDSAELQQWALQQNIPISLWIETSPEKWEKADFFNLIGPRAPRRDVLSLDLSKIQGDRVRIKLTSGFLFWEIDYVALDFSPDQPMHTRVLPLASATDQEGRDLNELLRSDDDQYYVQPKTGDEARLSFPASPALPGMERSLFLHAKGHYQILREPVEGKPSRRYLRTFTHPDAFPKYSREQWNALMQQEIIWSADPKQ